MQILYICMVNSRDLVKNVSYILIATMAFSSFYAILKNSNSQCKQLI